MGRYVFKLPDVGEGTAEAEIVAWHVKVGDMVAEDQQLADMMTDKATVEMESPVAGKVLRVAGLAISYEHISVIVVTILLVAVIYLFFTYTRIGVAMQATAQNQLAAGYVGIPVRSMFSLVRRSR